MIARNSDRIAVRVYGRSLLKDNIDALRALAQERDAIQAKTIEECEQAIIEYGKKNGVSRHTHGPLAAIRAKNIT